MRYGIFDGMNSIIGYKVDSYSAGSIGESLHQGKISTSKVSELIYLIRKEGENIF